MQVMVEHDGGLVTGAAEREFGHAQVLRQGDSRLLAGLSDSFQVWMSHGDQVKELPSRFSTVAATETCPHVAIEDTTSDHFGVQFHPEVVHTPDGKALLKNFLVEIAGLEQTWKMASFCTDKVASIRQQVGEHRVILGLSGGVDSSVAAALIHRAVGERLTCVYVNHGLHRQGEVEGVRALFEGAFNMNLVVVDAVDRFMDALSGVTDPEEKRRRIGHVFIDVFEEEARKVGDAQFLGQGTLYPDVIESVSFVGGPSAVIKSHHNVGGLPERMHLKLVEPLRELFKDEVRALGAELDLPKNVLMRQPFPGPGLAVRILGEVTKARCTLLRQADQIATSEIEAAFEKGLIDELPWQYFAALLPVKSVGVMGDARVYADTIAIRAVVSTDGMTADWPDLPKVVLSRISNRIINEVRGVSRVVYDISSKPPATIEWE
jgi:GMP synthase (glutamine-hydrolysing)